MSTSQAGRIKFIVNQLLDKNYDSATKSVLNAITASTQSGIIKQRLDELNAESARLSESGERLTPDNPVLRALLADLDDTMKRNASRLDGIAPDVQRLGTEAGQTLAERLAIPEQYAGIVAQWNRPDIEAINQLIDYVNTPAFAQELAKYGDDVVSIVKNQAIRGIVEGWGPLRTSAEIRRITSALPAHKANMLMRTLQLQSYRRSTAIAHAANRDIIVKQVRIATLDTRVCIACVALHGEEMPLGAQVIDHHAGRCTSIAIVRGLERDIPTGESWFNGLTEADQLALAGPGKLELLQSGKATLKDFVQPYEDAVFGDMLREASIKFVNS